MSIISEALQDQELAAALFRQRSPFRRLHDDNDQRDFGPSMYEAITRRIWRTEDNLIRQFIHEHTGHFTTDPTLEGAKALVAKLKADGILCVFIIPPHPCPKLFMLARREPPIGERYQPGDIIATLELPRP